MIRTNRTCCVLAALLVVFSAIALAGHLTLHANGPAEHCMMCASHADTPGAGPAADYAVPVSTGQQAAPGVAEILHIPVPSGLTPQPRAPPAIS
jgi:hypothetical protein